MQDRPTERVRVLLDGLTASAIVDRVHPYYSGYQFEGEWLDTLKESIEGELDDLDRIIRGRAGTVGAAFAHHHAPTVEDVLAEMLDVWGELPSNVTNEAIIAEYAAKLTLRGDE